MTDDVEEFRDIDDVATRLSQVGYLTDEQIATTVYLATRLERPLLLEGPAGVGKTDLARSLATVLGRPLVRLQCYESQDESKALYEWDYGKQLLYTQILREKIAEIVGDAPDLSSAVERIADREEVFFSERFLSERPILAAIRSETPVVLLVDEIDRADEALEAVLLETLAENQVSVPEIGTIAATHPPLVVLTSNNTRDLSTALKRRCLHLFLDYPDRERELEIVRSKKTGLADALATELVDVVHELRGLELRKAPSISETVDWARTLAVLGATELGVHNLATTANVVMKYERDLQRALRHLRRRYDVEVPVPEPGGTSDPGPAETDEATTPSPPPPGGQRKVRVTPPEVIAQTEAARRREPPPDMPDSVVGDRGPEEDRGARRARRDALDTKGRHGAAAFFGARRTREDPPRGTGRRPV